MCQYNDSYTCQCESTLEESATLWLQSAGKSERCAWLNVIIRLWVIGKKMTQQVMLLVIYRYSFSFLLWSIFMIQKVIKHIPIVIDVFLQKSSKYRTSQLFKTHDFISIDLHIINYFLNMLTWAVRTAHRHNYYDILVTKMCTMIYLGDFCSNVVPACGDSVRL